MSSGYLTKTSKKACTRCSTHKRRCDRGLPSCGLCLRLQQTCKYPIPISVPSTPSTPPTPSSNTSTVESLVSVCALKPSNLKDAIDQQLQSVQPVDVTALYFRAIDPWFPVLSESMLGIECPKTWHDCSLDCALLSIAIVLVTTAPSSSDEGDTNPKCNHLYLQIKMWISLTEGLGINSLETVQARILVTLFEAAHGRYPAAFLSIGATVRAIDALDIHPMMDLPSKVSEVAEVRQQAELLTWCGIIILDRYIAIESGPRLSLTARICSKLNTSLKSHLCPTHLFDQDHTTQLCRMSRLLEASTLVDKVHTIFHDPVVEQDFNMQETVLVVKTLDSLETILTRENGLVGDGNRVYCGGLMICHTGLILAYENGSKVPPLDPVTTNCGALANTAIEHLLTILTDITEPFVSGTQILDFDQLPLFAIFLIYKAAAIATERLWMDAGSGQGLRRLRNLRAFLKLVGKRWGCCDRYLKLLNEDTTPRTLKAIEQLGTGGRFVVEHH